MLIYQQASYTEIIRVALLPFTLHLDLALLSLVVSPWHMFCSFLLCFAMLCFFLPSPTHLAHHVITCHAMLSDAMSYHVTVTSFHELWDNVG